MRNNKLLNIGSDFFPVFLLIFFGFVLDGQYFCFSSRRYSTLNAVIILNFKATYIMCCYGQLATNLMQFDLSVFVLNLLSSVQSFSRVGLFATPWTAACQATLSITNSWNLLKLMFIDLVMPSNHRILTSPSLPAFNIS